MEFVRISEKYGIYELLTEFSKVFPHLSEKVSNLEDYAEKLSKSAFVYVAQEGVENAGILVFYANNLQDKVAYISLIGIKKKYQHRGLGKAILDHCVVLSRQSGMNIVRLEVDADNFRAIEFYKKNGFGFVEETERKSFYMMKNI